MRGRRARHLKTREAQMTRETQMTRFQFFFPVLSLFVCVQAQLWSSLVEFFGSIDLNRRFYRRHPFVKVCFSHYIQLFTNVVILMFYLLQHLHLHLHALAEYHLHAKQMTNRRLQSLMEASKSGLTLCYNPPTVSSHCFYRCLAKSLKNRRG